MTLHHPDFGQEVASANTSKAKRQAMRKESRRIKVLTNENKTKFKISLHRVDWTCVWEDGEWLRRYGYESSDKWQEVANALELLVLTGTSWADVEKMASDMKKLQQNRQQYSKARWNNGRSIE